MSVKVAVRVRPFNQRQKFLGCLNCIQMKDKTTILINPRDRSQKEHQFTFDYSFWSHQGFEELENGYLYPIDDRFVDQKKIFKELGEDIIKSAWNGFNCCLFAYGQTGAGKSYSMIGYKNNPGIVPQSCERIFEGISKKTVKGKKQFELSISMLQIYNEKVQDLFMHTSKRQPNGLRIRQNKKCGVYVQGLSKFQVYSYQEIERKMEQGAKNRSLASTLMNQYSSRAHTIVIIEFVQKEFITELKMNKKTSTLNLVDLAGSQRVSKTGINSKDRLKEASQINKSLHTLGRVIQHLAEVAAGKKAVQVPYRDSCLTRILETALGGNSMTTMICAVSPANDNYQETLSTLRYADQAKKIKNKPIINQSAVDKIIRELRQQNQRLKDMLKIAKMKGINIQKIIENNPMQENEEDLLANIQEIQKQIRKTMQSFAINTDDLDTGQQDLISQFIDIPDPNDFYSGDLSFQNPFNNVSTSNDPNLKNNVSSSDMSITIIGNSNANVYITNLSEDTFLSFKIKYSCEKELFIGNKNLKDGENAKYRLILCGLGVEDRHARIFQVLGESQKVMPRYFIEALSEAAGQYTIVNGRPILYDLNHGSLMNVKKNFRKKGLRELFHNDRLIFGTNSIFLFKNLLAKQQNEKKLLSPPERTSTGISTDFKTRNSKKKHEQKLTRKSIMLLDDDDDDQNDESMLLDWAESQQDNNPQSFKNQKKQQQSISKNRDSISIGTSQQAITKQLQIPQELLDFQFAINERQNYLFETSTSSSVGGSSLSKINPLAISNHNEEMQKKLQFIEEEFKELVKQNQRKLKEKEEKFKEELLRIDKQRELQKENLIKQLREKEMQAKKIVEEKENIEKIKNMLMKEKQKRKQLRESMLLDNQNNDNSKNVQTKTEYIDRHHFHYDYNVIHNTEWQRQGNINQLNSQEQKRKQQQTNKTQNSNITNITNNIYQNKTNQYSDKQIIDPSFNTTAMTNQINQQQSLLLDHNNQQIISGMSKKKKNQEQGLIEISNDQKQSKNQRQFDKCLQKQENQTNRFEKQKNENKQGENKRKNSLNFTDILYPPTNDRKRINSGLSSDEQNLLANITATGQKLVSYIPQQNSNNQNSNKNIPNRRGSQSIELDYSKISTDRESKELNFHLFDSDRQEELNRKILELQEKLKNLEHSKQENRESILNIRKSFAITADRMSNSQNFHLNKKQLEFQEMEELELSAIVENANQKQQDLEEKAIVESRLKLSMINAQNENIINQRSLQIRKRKRQAEQIQGIFLKKSKRDLHKQLIELIPMLEKFNLWARQMNRNLEGKVHIQYRNFTHFEIVQALKNKNNQSKVSLMIKIINFEERRSYKWPVEIFYNRYQILNDLFERFLENPDSELFSDKKKDPFWDPRDYQPYAVAYLTLEPLCYGLGFEGEISFVEKGIIIGYLDVVLEPVVDKKSIKLRQKLEQDLLQRKIKDPRQSLQNNLLFTLSIQNFRPTEQFPLDKVQKYYISYELLEDNYKTIQFKTSEISKQKKQINYMFKHIFRNISENTLAYIADSPVQFALNVLFDYDDELENMSSSFLSQSQTSFLNTSLSPSQKSESSFVVSPVSQDSGGSSSAFGKKKAVFVENTDVLLKLDQQYKIKKQQEKKRQQKKKQYENYHKQLKKKQKTKSKEGCRTS